MSGTSCSSSSEGRDKEGGGNDALASSSSEKKNGGEEEEEQDEETNPIFMTGIPQAGTASVNIQALSSFVPSSDDEQEGGEEELLPLSEAHTSTSTTTSNRKAKKHGTTRARHRAQSGPYQLRQPRHASQKSKEAQILLSLWNIG
jgi:hypothetical protein